MFRQLQRSVRRKKLVRAAVLFALALLLLALFAPGLAAMVRGPADLYAADIDGLEGRYVAARVDIIYDWYAETVRRDSTGTEQTVRRNYIIPVGSSQFMGLDVDTARLGEAQAVLASTAAVMEGRAESLDGSAVVVRGTIRRMDAQEQEFYRSVANYGSLTADDQARFLPLVLVCGQVGNYTEQTLQLGVLAAALLALAGLAAAVRAVTSRGPAQPAAYLAAAAGEQAPLLWPELDEFYRQTPPLGQLRANCRWVLCENGADSWLLYAPDVVWVYRVQGRRRGVVLCARSPQARRRRYFIPAASPAEADHILDRLYPLLPNAVFGYQPAWEPLYRAHPGRFSADIRAEQQAAREAAARRAAETAGSAAAPAAPPAQPGSPPQDPPDT